MAIDYADTDSGSQLGERKRAIFSAASHAQRAADFLHGLQQSATAQASAA
jgi:antirestriction protein ArdC